MAISWPACITIECLKEKQCAALAQSMTAMYAVSLVGKANADFVLMMIPHSSDCRRHAPSATVEHKCREANA
jgi:hypothetical protein